MSPHTRPPAPQLLDGTRTDRVHWLELPAVGPSVGAARRSVGQRLDLWRLSGDVRADAVLIVSELTTNAIRHTSSKQILCCAGLTSDGLVHIEVHDHDVAPRSLPPRCAGPDDEGGRGLLLVQEIADKWGVERSLLTGGNAVWAALTGEPPA
ncbi:ATP-binding protein [Streptomyces sp. NPDC058001]|uniref:ATP-binding protein n=1 Tax=Streptomyces sp. NPDC058001 TaxID=3346300 RepID=UPI0036E3AA7D